MEEAREERARVLAAREAGGAADPGAPAPGDPAGGHDAPVSPEGGGPGKQRGAAPGRFRWWIGGGFLAGAAVGAAAIWALLYIERAEPPVAEVGGASAPAVASAPTPSLERANDEPSTADGTARERVPSDNLSGDAQEAADTAPLPPIPIQEGAADAPPAPESATTDTAPADDVSVDAQEAADAPPLPARAATVETEVDIAAPPLSDTAGTEASPDGETADDSVAASGSAPLPAVQPAPAPTEVPSSPPTDADPDQEPEPTFDAADSGGTNGSSIRAPQETAPPAPSGAAADFLSADADSARSSDVESGEDEANAGTAESTPAESPPQPPATLAASVADAAGDDAAPEAPMDGRGILHVHAAPQVTADELAGVVERLSGAGYAIEETRRVDFRISRTNVRYFHAEDAELAAGVAEAVSGISRDFTDYEPAPDAGTIEVWLEG